MSHTKTDVSQTALGYCELVTAFLQWLCRRGILDIGYRFTARGIGGGILSIRRPGLTNHAGPPNILKICLCALSASHHRTGQQVCLCAVAAGNVKTMEGLTRCPCAYR